MRGRQRRSIFTVRVRRAFITWICGERHHRQQDWQNWAFWPFGGAWMCRNLYEEYLFTQDREICRRFSVWRTCQICSNMLQKTDKGLAVVPATSPEKLFSGSGRSSAGGTVYRKYSGNYSKSVTGIIWKHVKY